MSIRNVVVSLTIGVLLAVFAQVGGADEPANRMKIGLIGLDTSHVSQFSKLLNKPNPEGKLAEATIVAAYPGGSPDMPESWDRVKGFTKELRGRGIEIVDSIDALLQQVDAVMLTSVDGRVHLAQARPVIAAGKPLWIDKPMASTLADAIQIFRLAKEKNVPCFSSSPLRFSSGFQAARNGTSEVGAVRNCTAWAPAGGYPGKPEPFWFHGIHGVEILFTVMGPGCKTVTQTAPGKIVGTWKDHREGIMVVRGKEHKGDYGAEAEGTKGKGNVGKSEGYVPVTLAVLEFFKTGKSPVSPEETIEILAFMDAADESQRQNGAPVSLESVIKKAEEQIAAANGRH